MPNEVTIHVREEGTAQTQAALGGLKASAVAGAVAITAAFGGVVVATREVAGVVSASVGAYLESERAGVKLEAIIKATGNTLVRTREDYENYSTTLQRATGVSDEAITEMQGILLTFRNVGAEVFDRTAAAALDMSTVFGQDLQSSAVQLGKALQDPIAGMTALRRIGISFTESQVDAIKKFKENNDILSAQKLILAEVEKQVGGTARAMGDTATGKANRFKEAMGDLQEQLGGAVVNGLSPLQDAAMEWAQSTEAEQFTKDLASALKDASGQAVGLFGALKNLVSSSPFQFTVRVIKEIVGADGGGGWASAIGDFLAGPLAIARDIPKQLDDLMRNPSTPESIRKAIMGTEFNNAPFMTGNGGTPVGGWNTVNEEAIAEWTQQIYEQRAAAKEAIPDWHNLGGEVGKATDAIAEAERELAKAREDAAQAAYEANMNMLNALAAVAEAERALAEQRRKDAFDLAKGAFGAGLGANTRDNNGNLFFGAGGEGAALTGINYGTQNVVLPNVGGGNIAAPSTADGFAG